MNENIFYLLDYLREKGEAYNQTIRKKYNLNESEYFFFIAFKKCDCINSCIMAKSMGISLSRISRIIDNLVKKELLVRTTDENDRRSIIIKLTPAGTQLLKNINAERSNNESKLLQHTNLADFTALKQSIQNLIDLL